MYIPAQGYESSEFRYLPGVADKNGKPGLPVRFTQPMKLFLGQLKMTMGSF